MTTSALKEASDRAGGQSALARLLSTPERSVKQGHVWDWLNRDSGAPLEFCPAIEALTGVRCEQLRGDVTWARDDEGRVTGYAVELAPTDDSRAA